MNAPVQRRAYCHSEKTTTDEHACSRAVSGANAIGHVTQAVVSLKRLARSDARAASGGSTRNVAGRLAAAVDAQNGIDMVGVAGLLEGARSSVIEARKARFLQLFLRRCVVCRGAGRPGIEAPEWSGGACVNVGASWVLSMGRGSERCKSCELVVMPLGRSQYLWAACVVSSSWGHRAQNGPNHAHYIFCVCRGVPRVSRAARSFRQRERF